MSSRINYIISEIKDQYLINDNFRPWIIGFSGGKDSTTLLQLVWCAISQVESGQRKREVHVVCNDTLVENPIIQSYVREVLRRIEIAAVEQNLPIKVSTTIPRLDDCFWVNVIGRGYPVPNNTFRWCTDKMKIKPTSNFITNQVAKSGEAIILIGTRSAESATRARSIKRHEIRGKRLTKHPHHRNTYVYAPIKELMLEEVWYIINTMPSPWGADNSQLFKIYLDASADDYECPTMVTDKSHGSCGQSRFGCWTCTVVKEDKSLMGLIEKGQTWLKPLLDIRTQMFEDRNKSENRLSTRRNGQLAVTEDGHNQGNYTHEYRAKLLEQLLKAQYAMQFVDSDIELITKQELIVIQMIWRQDLARSKKKGAEVIEFKTVAEIYNSVYNSQNMNTSNEKTKKEADLLKDVCQNEQDFELIQELLQVQSSKATLNRQHGIKNDLEQVIEKYIKTDEECI